MQLPRSPQQSPAPTCFFYQSSLRIQLTCLPALTWYHILPEQPSKAPQKSFWSVMNMRQPLQERYGFEPVHYSFGVTASSSRSSTPSVPSPPYTGVLDQVIGGRNLYDAHFAYDAQMQQYIPEAQPQYVQQVDLFSITPFSQEMGYQCIAPPELHFGPPPPFLAPPQAQPEYKPLPSEVLSRNMLPAPSGAPSFELPKRKGERALARLHRSAVDPDRHWPCNQCIQKFSRKSDLTRHLKRHAGRKDYPCTAPSCPLPNKDRQFYRADARRRHWLKSPECEIAFYKTPEGIAWTKKNGNRRGVITPYFAEDSNDDYGDNSDDAESSYTE